MKKSMMLCAALGTALMMAACGGGSSSTTTAAPAETKAAETTAAETRAAETAAAETKAAETKAEETRAEETNAADDLKKGLDLTALMEDEEGDPYAGFSDNALLGIWWYEDDHGGTYIDIHEDGSFVVVSDGDGDAEFGSYEMTGEYEAEGELGDGHITMFADPSIGELTLSNGEVDLMFARDLNDEPSDASLVADYWYPDGDTSQGYMLLNPDGTLELLDDGGTEEGAYAFDGTTLTLTIDAEQIELTYTDGDSLLYEDEDESIHFLRGSKCGGLTLDDSGNRWGGRAIEITIDDATHTRVRDFDNRVSLTYPDHMTLFDDIGDGIAAGDTDGCVVIVRNVTEWWETYNGTDADLLREYYDLYIKPDFANYYGDFEGETEPNSRDDSGHGSRTGVLTGNIWNTDADMLVKSGIYIMEYEGEDDRACIIKTVFGPFENDSLFKEIWKETTGLACRSVG